MSDSKQGGLTLTASLPDAIHTDEFVKPFDVGLRTSSKQVFTMLSHVPDYTTYREWATYHDLDMIASFVY